MYRLVNQRRGGQFYKKSIDSIEYKQRNNQELTQQQLKFYQTNKEKYKFFDKHFCSIKSKVQSIAYEQHKKKMGSAHFPICDLNDRILGYQRDRHNSIYCDKYQYEEVLPCEDTIIQMIDYFLFELKEKIHLPIFSQGNWNDPELVLKVRNHIRSQLPKNPFKDLIITPLGISNSLKTFWKSNEKEFLESSQKLKEIHAVKDPETVWIQKIANEVLKLFSKSIEFMKLDFEKEIGEFADELKVEEKLTILRAKIMGEQIEIDRQTLQRQRIKKDEIEKLKVLQVNSTELQGHYLSRFIKKPAYMISYFGTNSLLQNCIQKKIFCYVRKTKDYCEQLVPACYYSTGYLMKMLKLSMDDIFEHMQKRNLSKADKEKLEVKKLEKEFKSLEDTIENVEAFVHKIKKDI